MTIELNAWMRTVVNSTIKLTPIINWCVGQAKQATKYKDDRDDDAIIQSNNDGSKRTRSICLPSSVLINLRLGERATLRSTRSKKSLYKKFSIGLQELILILPKILNLFPWPRDSIWPSLHKVYHKPLTCLLSYFSMNKALSIYRKIYAYYFKSNLLK